MSKNDDDNGDDRKKQMHFHIRNFVPLHICTYTNIAGLQLAKYDKMITVTLNGS